MNYISVRNLSEITQMEMPSHNNDILHQGMPHIQCNYIIHTQCVYKYVCYSVYMCIIHMQFIMYNLYIQQIHITYV